MENYDVASELIEKLFDRKLGLVEKEDLIKTAIDFFDKMYEDGYNEGHKEGENEGYEEGHNDGYYDGEREGESIGYRKGYDACEATKRNEYE